MSERFTSKRQESAQSLKKPGDPAVQSQSNAKSEKFWQILDALLLLEVSEGHLKWTFQQLSKTSKVHRTSIYYYFGKSKNEILEQALKTIGEYFFGMTENRLALWKEGKITDSILETRDLVNRAPHLVEFYFHWKRKPQSMIAKELLRLENQYISKAQKFFPTLTKEKAQGLYGVFFGLTLAPHIQKEDLKALVDQALNHYQN